jgi:uncharacterized protein (TIGR00730 family)
MKPERLPRHRTGDPDLDQQLVGLLDAVGLERNRDQVFEILSSVVHLAQDDADRLNLKITNAALKEMRSAFKVFAPYQSTPKVTIFGSARTLPDDPLYAQTRDLADALASAGWMVVTGAGPGIMAAGAEGAGLEHSIGVNIRLPFEQGANPFIEADTHLVEMKYFFTRKLMLMKESDGFVVLPGGFGTLDEAFELLTLLQTGKSVPAPIVLLEVPGGTYWHAWADFMHEVEARRLIDAEDASLYRITADVQAAVDEITGFYCNYHSIRYVGDRLIIRLRGRPTAGELQRLNAEFADITTSGRIVETAALAPEVSDDDHVDLPRLALHFDRLAHGRLRTFIDALNRLPSAPRG